MPRCDGVFRFAHTYHTQTHTNTQAAALSASWTLSYPPHKTVNLRSLFLFCSPFFCVPIVFGLLLDLPVDTCAHTTGLSSLSRRLACPPPTSDFLPHPLPG